MLSWVAVAMTFVFLGIAVLAMFPGQPPEGMPTAKPIPERATSEVATPPDPETLAPRSDRASGAQDGAAEAPSTDDEDVEDMETVHAPPGELARMRAELARAAEGEGE